MFRWPPAARVDRELPKERLYKEGAVGAALRRNFIAEVRRIRWAYKLGEESIRLRGNDSVPEVQIFEIELKGDDVSDAVLAAIDRSVPSPILFELHRTAAGRAEVQLVAAIKRRGPRTASVGHYLRSGWALASAHRQPLPPAVDLPGLYTQLLLELLPVPPRRGEDLASALDRVERTRKLRRHIDQLSKRMQREPQFNRKVELRAQIRGHQEELDGLLAPIDTTVENP